MWNEGALARAFLMQRGHLFPWSAVLFALGIGLYFALPAEPSAQTLGLAGVAAIGLGAAALRAGWHVAPALWAVALVAAGFAVAGARANVVAAPVLEFRYYGAVEGRVRAIDRSASDALRLTLDQVRLERMAPGETPAKVRVALHGAQEFLDPVPGTRVILTAFLSPPQGPVEPGGFDFRRHAWFQGLGAVGYTRTPVLVLAPPSAEMAAAVARARMALSARVQDALPGEAGGFAAAVLSGDRSGIGQDTLRALRESNLAHLLAISGLHMGLLAGFVFAALRLAILALPRAGVRLPAKKLAACGALLAAAGYLALSGGNIATERAFVMAAVALLAVMLDRRAISLRAVALAALIVLALRPEALMGPGFQMSFAATTALVAVFAALRDRKGPRPPRWLAPVLAVVVSSSVAGAATAPIGAAHFNQLSHFGLPANLLAVPLMGLLVIPAGVVAILLMPLGGEAVPLRAMGLGLDWILGVAHRAAGMPNAVGHVPAPPPAVLPLLALGGAFVALWRGHGRWAGLVPALVALALWTGTARPPVLVADEGALVGVMTADGRALSKERGAGFPASVWLENDGDGATRAEAVARWPEAGPVRHVWGKRRAANFEGCAPGEIVVMTERYDGPAQPCLLLDARRLEGAGSLAIWPDPGGHIIESATLREGRRLWTPATVAEVPARLAAAQAQ
ncbi:ComEC/Rec2 family competence protein [Rhodosalinus sp. FB01]|uniref:ComEC/Rec2 family competence protein n=1 Tax=Rhodosalinus sp. FB01 TaxID=3239194 RepID=UPI003523B82F